MPYEEPTYCGYESPKPKAKKTKKTTTKEE